MLVSFAQFVLFISFFLTFGLACTYFIQYDNKVIILALEKKIYFFIKLNHKKRYVPCVPDVETRG